MKKIILIGSVVILLVGAYLAMTGGGESGDGKSGDPATDSGVVSGIRNTLGGESADQKHDADNPHVVVIGEEPNPMDADDVVERLETFKNSAENERLDFARWAVLKASYSTEEREKIFDRAVEVMKPEEIFMLTRDVLFVGNDADLYEKAFSLHTKDMDRPALEQFVREALRVREDPAFKASLSEFAASKNIYIR